MNHSEAPWSIDADGDLQDAHGNKIVDMHITRGRDIPVLVAAPEMLEALRGLMAAIERGDEGVNEYRKADAAIAKAEGRTS